MLVTDSLWMPEMKRSLDEFFFSSPNHFICCQICLRFFLLHSFSSWRKWLRVIRGQHNKSWLVGAIYLNTGLMCALCYRRVGLACVFVLPLPSHPLTFLSSPKHIVPYGWSQEQPGAVCRWRSFFFLLHFHPCLRIVVDSLRSFQVSLAPVWHASVQLHRPNKVTCPLAAGETPT